MNIRDLLFSLAEGMPARSIKLQECSFMLQNITYFFFAFFFSQDVLQNEQLSSKYYSRVVEEALLFRQPERMISNNSLTF